MSIQTLRDTSLPFFLNFIYRFNLNPNLRKMVWAALAVWGWTILFTASGQAEVSSTSKSRLRELKIEAFKRELRVLPPKPEASARTQSMQRAYDENRFEEVVRQFDQFDASEKDENALLMYGNSLLFADQKTEAVAVYQEVFKTGKTPQAQSAALANFGVLFSMSDRWNDAVNWLEKALEIDRDSDHWLGQGLALSQLGVFYFKLGNTEKGAAAHIEALEIAETMAIPWLEARQLSHLAGLYYRDKVYHLAQDYYEKAIQIYQKLDDPLSEAGALSALSFVHKELGDVSKALSFQASALQVYKKLQDRDNAAKVWLNISLMHRDMGQFEKALKAANEALIVHGDTKNPTILAEIEGTLGTIQEKKGNLAQAVFHLKKARGYFEQAGASQEIHVVDLKIQTLEDQMDTPF